MSTIYKGDPRLNIERYEDESVTKKPGKWQRLFRGAVAIPLDAVGFLFQGIAGRFDTISFTDRPDYLYKLETVHNWTEVPCGSSYANHSDFSAEHFRQIEDYRYRTHAWLKAQLDSFGLAGKRVLEIGYGAGSDHCILAKQSGEIHGIDLTPRSKEVTTAHLRLHGLSSNLRTGDAELLPYKSDFFDFVYSFGVIHHSPNTEQVVNEIHRVLKPGGLAFVAVYHKNSIFFWWSVFFLGFLLRGGWRKRSLRQQISLVEFPNTNPNLVIRLYTRAQVANLFRQFSECRTHVRHLNPCDVDIVCRLYKDQLTPTPFLHWLGQRLGWYVVAEVRK